MKKLLILPLLWLAMLMAIPAAATQVSFDTVLLTGQSLNRQIVITPDSSILATNHLLYAGLTIRLMPTNGVAVTNLLSGRYCCTIQGVASQFCIIVYDSTNTLNAADITDTDTQNIPYGITGWSIMASDSRYLFAPAGPLVAGQVVGTDGTNITWTTGGSGGGGGGVSLATTNGSGLTYVTNVVGTNIVVTGLVQTNLFELAGNAAAQALKATNGLAGLAAFYTPSQLTNGFIGKQDATNAATSATNGVPAWAVMQANGFSSNQLAVNLTVTPTNQHLIVGTLYATNGTHTVTLVGGSLSAQGVMKGWGIGFTNGSDEQYVVDEIINDTNLTTTYYISATRGGDTTGLWYPNAINFTDNTRPVPKSVGGIMNDGGVAIQGQGGNTFNSGRLWFLNGSNTFSFFGQQEYDGFRLELVTFNQQAPLEVDQTALEDSLRILGSVENSVVSVKYGITNKDGGTVSLLGPVAAPAGITTAGTNLATLANIGAPASNAVPSAIVVSNATAASSGTIQQYSPALIFDANYWNGFAPIHKRVGLFNVASASGNQFEAVDQAGNLFWLWNNSGFVLGGNGGEVKGSLTVDSSISAQANLTVQGNVVPEAVGPSHLVGTDANTNLTALTVGSGLNLSGGTLTATGGGGGSTPTFNVNQFGAGSGADGTNIVSNVLLTNVNAHTLLTQTNATTGNHTDFTQGGIVASNFQTGNWIRATNGNITVGNGGSAATVTVTESSGDVTATTFTGSGANLTALNGTQVTSGTVADARLSGNVGLLNGNQTWTGNNTWTGPYTIRDGGNASGTVMFGVQDSGSHAVVSITTNNIALTNNTTPSGVVMDAAGKMTLFNGAAMVLSISNAPGTAELFHLSGAGAAGIGLLTNAAGTNMAFLSDLYFATNSATTISRLDIAQSWSGKQFLTNNLNTIAAAGITNSNLSASSISGSDANKGEISYTLGGGLSISGTQLSDVNSTNALWATLTNNAAVGQVATATASGIGWSNSAAGGSSLPVSLVNAQVAASGVFTANQVLTYSFAQGVINTELLARSAWGATGYATNFTFGCYNSNPLGYGTNLVFRVNTNGVDAGILITLTGSSQNTEQVTDTTHSFFSSWTNLVSVSISNTASGSTVTLRPNWSFEHVITATP